MSLAHAEAPFSETDYLEIERAGLERHEYLDGQVYAMAGESLDHDGLPTVHSKAFICNILH